MKIGWFKQPSDPFEKDERGITFRVVLGAHSCGWGVSFSMRDIGLYLGHLAIDVKFFDAQVLESRVGAFVKELTEKAKS